MPGSKYLRFFAKRRWALAALGLTLIWGLRHRSVAMEAVSDSARAVPVAHMIPPMPAVAANALPVAPIAAADAENPSTFAVRVMYRSPWALPEDTPMLDPLAPCLADHSTPSAEIHSSFATAAASRAWTVPSTGTQLPAVPLELLGVMSPQDMGGENFSQTGSGSTAAHRVALASGRDLPGLSPQNVHTAMDDGASAAGSIGQPACGEGVTGIPLPEALWPGLAGLVVVVCQWSWSRWPCRARRKAGPF